jgi:hypothetical protein
MMPRLLLLAVMLVAGPAAAAVFAHAITDDGRTLNLHDTKCADGGWKAELIAPSGKLLFDGCWVQHPRNEEAILGNWDGGSKWWAAPKSMFKEGPRPGGT